MRYIVAVMFGYLVALATFAFSSDEVIPEWIAFVVIFVLPFAVGFGAGLWGLLVLPLAVLIAVPAGYGLGEFPIWFQMLFIGIIAIPAIVIGWGARLAVKHYLRQSPRWTS